jgi:hypothetical protein
MKTIDAKIIDEGLRILLRGPDNMGLFLLGIDLTDRKLGQRLLNGARGGLPLAVWYEYLSQNNGQRSELDNWGLNPDDPQFAPIHPQRAVDEAEPLVSKAIVHLRSDSPLKALDPLFTAIDLLARGSSRRQRGRGQAASMRHLAVRAWVIRKFNPLPQKPAESTVGLARVADLLFLENGKCPRKITDDDGRIQICGASEHGYDSRCVKALRTAVGNLKSAMKRDGIPI